MNRQSRFFRTLIKRCFHCTQNLKLDPRNVEEVRIPVPWGHIAGKWWGRKDVVPVLAVHGWEGNAGSWDPLMEAMTVSGRGDRAVLAVDLPGCGRSAHFPPFQSYNFSDMVLLLRRISSYFGFGPLTILAHGGGAEIALFYAAFYPNDVTGYFAIDNILYTYKDNMQRVQRKATIIDNLLKISTKNPKEETFFDHEELRSLLIRNSKTSLNSRTAEMLMQRDTTVLKNLKLVYNKDPRLMTGTLDLLESAQAEKIVSQIVSRVVYVKATDSHQVDRCLKNCPKLLNLIQENAKSFEFYTMEGRHHLHMDSPHQLLPLVTSFLDTCALDELEAKEKEENGGEIRMSSRS